MSARSSVLDVFGVENQNVSERLKTSRRGFLKTSAAGLAVAPTIIPATALASADRPAASDRVVVGCIGTGDLGRRHHLNNMLLPNKRIEVAAVCDVDQNHRDQAAIDVFNKTKKRVGIYEDFRDLCDRTDIDAVLIATPDHWHALTSLYAMESGKDVYCEKPLTLTIDEGKKLVATARQYGTVFQTGSQQRSDNRFRLACELVRNGYIGELKTVDTYINNVGSGEWKPVTTPPPELNWDFYVGPAPYRDYSPNRVHYDFRWFLDFSGGKLTDWGLTTTTSPSGELVLMAPDQSRCRRKGSSAKPALSTSRTNLTSPTPMATVLFSLVTRKERTASNSPGPTVGSSSAAVRSKRRTGLF